MSHLCRLNKTIGMLFIIGIVIFLNPSNGLTTDQYQLAQNVFEVVNYEQGAVKAKISSTQFSTLEQASPLIKVTLPYSKSESMELELKRFEVIAPDTRFLIRTANSDEETQRPDVILWRGKIADEPASHAYLSITSDGIANGYVLTGSGEAVFIAQKADDNLATIGRATTMAELPPFADFCGYEPTDRSKMDSYLEQLGVTDTPFGTRMTTIAFDGDQAYYDIFGNATDANNYMVQLLGAVSDIYIRDFNVRLVLKFSRLWPSGGEPWSASSLSSFRNYWNDNEDTTGLQIIHLLTGQRNLPFGGVAYGSGICSELRYSISGFLNGSFPSPIDQPSNSNWDVIVMAHEMGHNLGTGHTHDSYTPTIDDCANGVPTMGTIMSYCHIWPGYTSNTFMRFHSRVQDVVESWTLFVDCMDYDCNGNGIPDTADITLGSSLDVNANDIPDECEDCNGNSVFDDIDIAGASNDVNNNGIPDECEPDCDNNGVPDEWEIENSLKSDDNGNNIPDGCEPDCNSNSIPDFADLEAGTSTDFDRNTVPDECQDCNSNATPDWLDTDRQFNLFVTDTDDLIREYHEVSGYPIQTLSLSSNDEPWDVVVGPDHLLYVACHGNNRILKIDPSTGVTTEFVPSAGSNLMLPSSLVFGPDGNLYVANFVSNTVTRYDGTTGAFIDIFVSGGSGGLNLPYGLTFGPDDHLYVTSSNNNTVVKYNGTTGALISTFVSSGSGGLDSPRGLTFDLDDNLLVCSFNTNNVLKYNGTTGALIGQFNDENDLDNPWGIRIGPNGDVFVIRTLDFAYQIIEYTHDEGRYFRSFVRRDTVLTVPTGLAFMPASLNDCNGNSVPDDCDITSGVLHDVNNNQVPDECEGLDSDNDGVVDENDNCDFAINPNQEDDDSDGIGNVCDNCINDSNPGQEDANLDGIGDACCCLNIRGNVNGDLGDNINVADVSFLVAHLFGIPTGPAPICPAEANANGDLSESVNVADVSYLVAYLFGIPTGPTPNTCP